MSPFLNKNSLRRAKETLAFSNWPIVLSQILLTQIGKGPDVASFVTRDGLRISCPIDGQPALRPSRRSPRTVTVCLGFSNHSVNDPFTPSTSGAMWVPLPASLLRTIQASPSSRSRRLR